MTGVQDAPELRIVFCNRAYADNWYKMLRRQSKTHFEILQAIIEEIQIRDGSDIKKADFFARRPDIQQKIRNLNFDPVPSGGQLLRHNGNGMRHAKFAPSKSIAVLWEKIGNVIYVTFDDHAPIRYHRAICHLRDLRLGRQTVLKRPRNSAKFLLNLKSYWRYRYSKEMRRFDPKRRYYE